jgi:FkbH-like protein
VNSVQEWLAGLALQIHIEPLGTGTLKRATQLLNKTNQMNLCTRRMSEHEFDRWAGLDGHFTLVFSVSDRFGEYGLTGIGSLSVQGDLAEIEDFLLSCRVFGRSVEATMLSALASLARQKGAQRLIATLLPTEKNQPTRGFFDERSGMQRDEGNRYSLDLEQPCPVPAHILCHGHPAMEIEAMETALGEAGS